MAELVVSLTKRVTDLLNQNDKLKSVIKDLKIKNKELAERLEAAQEYIEFQLDDWEN